MENIGLFNGLFKKMTPVSVKPKAVAFVDFEHWYISLEKLYHQKPDIKGWYNEMTKNYSVAEIYFFADFSNSQLKAEIPRIREVTNYVIETQNSSSYHKKDYTDFIMLDHIYQKAMTSHDIDTFIIFSGDGHFSSVVNFLCIRMKKPVGIYGIRDAVSGVLKSAATWLVEVPSKTDKKTEAYKLILTNLHALEAEHGTKSRAAFRQTVTAVSTANSCDSAEIADALRSMIDDGYVYQTSRRIKNKTIKVLNVNWEKAKADGIWQ